MTDIVTERAGSILRVFIFSKQRNWRTRSTLCDFGLPIPKRPLRRFSRSARRILRG
jgi:hypothetical protein